MADSKLYLGIDYGGNSVKMGLVDCTGQLSGRYSRPTDNLTDKVACRAFAAEAGEFVHGLGIYSSELGGVGLAIPGIASEDSFLTPNVGTNWPLLLECLSRTFAKPAISVLNDANAAALGELWMGAGVNLQSVLLVTVGSAIGSGLVVGGNVVSGGHGAAGEIGHMTVVPDGRLCKCGRKGCLERYASARGIVMTFNEAEQLAHLDADKFTDKVPLHETDALTVFQAAQAGDPRALFAIADAADKLGFALAQAACTIDPAIILIGGGLSQAENMFMGDLRSAYRKYAFKACAQTPIQSATLKGDAGIIGAARFAMLATPQDEAARDWLDPDFGL